MKYPITKKGIFWSIQGEGAMAGTPMAFVRLAGCSIGCDWCDTDYSMDRKLTEREIVAAVDRLPPIGESNWVWITGGEPTDYFLVPLVETLRQRHYRVAIATAGHSLRECSADWWSVSPHDTEWVHVAGAELKLIDGLGGMALDDYNVGDCEFDHCFVQPLWGDPESTKRCVAFVKKHPDWRISLQMHKYLDMP